jgi:hypothetical protein
MSSVALPTQPTPQENRFLGEVWVNKKGLAAAASANPSSFMVAGAGFEPATFGL